MVGRRRATHPERNLERPGAEPVRRGLAFQFERADQRRGAPKLVEGQEPKRVAHQHREAAMHGVGIAQPAKDQRERRQSEIGFRLAAAGWKEQEVDDLTLDMSGFGNAAQVHQDIGELERAPRRRVSRLGRDALLLRPSPPGRRRHGAVCDAERVQQVGIVEQVDAGLDATRRTGGPAHQLVGDLPSSAREGFRVFALDFDPGTIGADERVQRALGIRRVVQRAQRLHAELDTGDMRRFHTLHRRMGHPFGVHEATLAIGRFGAYGNVVADRVFRRVPVMQVGETLVPVVAVEAARVVARDEWPVRFHGHLDLESESRILHIVVLGGGPSIDDEQRNSAGVEIAFYSSYPGWPNQADKLETAAVRHVEPNRRSDLNRLETDIDGRFTRGRRTQGANRRRAVPALASPKGSSLTSTASLAVSSSGA